MDRDMELDRIEELLEKPYWIIDILPFRVPENSTGQYFAVEDYYLQEQISKIKQKHIDLILKLNCYLDIIVEGEINPKPFLTARIMKERYSCILVENSMIQSEPDDTCLTLYDPDEKLLELVKTLAAGEGLYVWKGAWTGT